MKSTEWWWSTLMLYWMKSTLWESVWDMTWQTYFSRIYTPCSMNSTNKFCQRQLIFPSKYPIGCSALSAIKLPLKGSHSASWLSQKMKPTSRLTFLLTPIRKTLGIDSWYMSSIRLLQKSFRSNWSIHLPYKKSHSPWSVKLPNMWSRPVTG